MRCILVVALLWMFGPGLARADGRLLAPASEFFSHHGTGRVCDRMGFCWVAPAPEGNRTRALVVHSAQDIWIGGEQGTIIHWDGKAWAGRTRLVDGNILGIWIKAPEDVWAVGTIPCRKEEHFIDSRSPPGWSPCKDPPGINNAVLLHWTADGWHELPPPTKQGLTAVWEGSDHQLWIAGEAGEVFTGDGHAWTEHRTPTAHLITALRGRSPDDVWAVGWDTNADGAVGRGVVDHWTGNGWVELTIPDPEVLVDVEPAGAGQAFVTTRWGRVWRCDGRAFVLVQPGGGLPVSVAGFGRIRGDGPQGDVLLGLGKNASLLSGSLPTGVELSNFNFVPLLAGAAFNDVWAGPYSAPTTIHWDGTAWHPASSIPQLGAWTSDPILALWATGEAVWIVTEELVTSVRGQTFEQQRDCRKGGPPDCVGYREVAGSSPDDVWVLGWYGTASVFDHWNGHGWTRESHAKEPAATEISPAVHARPLDLSGWRWDGQRWSLLPPSALQRAPPFGEWRASGGHRWRRETLSLRHLDRDGHEVESFPWEVRSAFVSPAGDVWVGGQDGSVLRRAAGFRTTSTEHDP